MFIKLSRLVKFMTVFPIIGGTFLLLLFPLVAPASACNNNWLYPSFKSVKADGWQGQEHMTFIASIIHYSNSEYYFFIQEKDKTPVEGYGFKKCVLVKGLSTEQMLSQESQEIFGFLEIFPSIISSLSAAIPKGPCQLTINVPVILKRNFGEGNVIRTSNDEIVYNITSEENSGLKLKFTGTLKFSIPQSPPKDINVTGYKLQEKVAGPVYVVGSPELPVTTIGEVKAFLEEKPKAIKSFAGEKKSIVIASEISGKAEDTKDIFKLMIGINNYKFGLFDRHGRVIVEPVFDDRSINDFSDDLAVISSGNMKEGERWGAIDKTGHFVIKPQFDYLGNFKDGIAPFKINKKWGIIDKSGKIIVVPKFEYDHIRDFEDGVAATLKNRSWGLIDKTGRIIIEPQFSYIDVFREGIAKVEKDKKATYINKSGKFIVPLIFSLNDLYGFKENVSPLKKNDNWGYIDKSGRFIIEPQFEYAHSFSNGLAVVNKNKKSGYIDKSGNFIIKPQFDYAQAFQQNGLAIVYENKKAGLINRNGNFIGKLHLDYITGDFRDGVATAQKDHKLCYIDEGGEIIITPKYVPKQLDSFSENLAPLRNHNRKTGYIDKTGKFVIEPVFDSGYPFRNGIARVYKNGKNAMIDKTGKIIVIHDIVCGLDVVKNGRGQIIWPRNILEFCK